MKMRRRATAKNDNTKIIKNTEAVEMNQDNKCGDYNVLANNDFRARRELQRQRCCDD